MACRAPSSKDFITKSITRGSKAKVRLEASEGEIGGLQTMPSGKPAEENRLHPGPDHHRRPEDVVAPVVLVVDRSPRLAPAASPRAYD